MNNICTSLEQSQKLIELGIDVNTADMYWWYSGKRYYVESMDDNDFHEKVDIPAWSLTALLKVIPKRIKDSNVLRIDISEEDFSIWYDDIGCGVNTELPDITMECPVDAVFEMICRLLENKKFRT